MNRVISYNQIFFFFFFYNPSPAAKAMHNIDDHVLMKEEQVEEGELVDNHALEVPYL